RDDGLLDDLPRDLRVLLEVAPEVLADGGLDDAFHVARDELALRLGVERSVRVLDVDDGDDALARVVAREAALHVLEEILFLTVGVERLRERGAEAGE